MGPDGREAAPGGTGAGSQKQAASTHERSGLQLSLDDAEEARRRRDAGLDAARFGVWLPWRERAEAALEDLAASGARFCADDLVERVGLPEVSGSPNAIGALFGAASRQGLIEAVGYTQSCRPSRNASVIRVWVGAEGGGDGD